MDVIAHLNLVLGGTVQPAQTLRSGGKTAIVTLPPMSRKKSRLKTPSLTLSRRRRERPVSVTPQAQPLVFGQGGLVTSPNCVSQTAVDH